jgi:hypothetical protein
MLKNIAITPLLVLCLGAAETGPTKDDLERRVVSLLTRVWGVDNLLISPFKVLEAKDPKTGKTVQSNDANAWMNLVEDISTFQADAKNDTLKQCMDQLHTASEAMIRTRAYSYNNNVRPGLASSVDPADGLSRIDANRMDFQKMDLKALVIDVRKLQDAQHGIITNMKGTLEDEKVTLLPNLTRARAATNDVIEVLESLRITLETVLDKFNSDLAKLQAAANANTTKGR